MKLLIKKISYSFILSLIALFALNACSSTSGSYCSLVVENEAPASEETKKDSEEPVDKKESQEKPKKSETKKSKK